MDVSRFVNKYDLSYTPDGIIVLNGKRYVVEIKSSNKNQFELMQGKGHPKGRKQLKLYMHFENCDRGIVLMDCKDNSNFEVFPVIGLDKDDPELKKSLDLLEEIQDYKQTALAKKKLPKCLCGKCLQ
jgi:hypothetical protein